MLGELLLSEGLKTTKLKPVHRAPGLVERPPERLHGVLQDQVLESFRAASPDVTQHGYSLVWLVLPCLPRRLLHVAEDQGVLDVALLVLDCYGQQDIGGRDRLANSVAPAKVCVYPCIYVSMSTCVLLA